MYSKSSFLAALLPVVTAQGSYGGGYGHGPVNGTYSLGWESLPGSIYLPTNDWANSNWPPQNVGMPLAPQAPDAELKELLEGVSIARIENIIQTLTNFGTRHTLSIQNSSTRGIGAARDWIHHEMLALAEPSNGNMDVFFNSYIQPVASRILFPTNITNVVARINGTEDPNRVYVVTGHYDSRRIDINDYTNDAPGSDDDASGVAVVMELARLCATKKPKATMIFAATAGEEQGLYGSDHLAKTLKAQGYNVEADFNNDIVGTGRNPPFDPINNYTLRLYGASIYYPNASSAVVGQEVAIIGAWNDSPAQNLGRFVTEVAVGAVSWVGMQVALIYRPDRYLRGGDHESFLLQGFPAVRFTEAVEDFAHEHQDPRMQDGIQYGDLPQFVDFEYTSRVAKVNLASMWSAANAPALPVNVTISEVIGFPAAAEDTPIEDISNDSRFAWAIGKDKLVSSYEVVWRPSGALQWTHSLNVGMTGNVTLALNKDNVQVGVRAVGADGKKSPAVFPFPINA
ncbi:hypothetical protein LTR35_004658 [Friedmanniomyces endolithicus]|uniref:Peptide hydrolase n=1 Tax=Friedmanniomyces endolithicus TaxID=329885 RepID=A0A4U0UNM5_9PEZI|nr:hypothetical protein LTS09_009308 [Friedmanniomyces endolithicus]KAK0286224.1 hypothetical protein LTR35_004658 [Friedmanniomyces endolithicus]KAK0299123.1 hypothetical protein LTS00_002233 [Friedmanniomyces endolithicus]KAK0306772.1 hypothetical protein LTR01_006068 [Friedmanniomyces endolithicus]KAK0322777.1 hypothetical protein LTR82_006234 [Friedmanniomyces endolithicus]